MELTTLHKKILRKSGLLFFALSLFLAPVLGIQDFLIPDNGNEIASNPASGLGSENLVEPLGNSSVKTQTSQVPGNSEPAPLSSETWFEGESVNVSFDSKRITPRRTIDLDYDIKLPDVEGNSFDYYFLDNGGYYPAIGNEYGASYWEIMLVDGGGTSTDDNEVCFTLHWAIDTKGQYGKLYYNLTQYVWNSTWYVFSGVLDGNYEINESYIGGNGYIGGNIMSYTFFSGTADNDIYFNLYNLGSQTYDAVRASTPTSDNEVSFVLFRISSLYFEPNVVNAQIRSEYQYTTSSSLIHRLFIENFAYDTTITVYAPYAWNYSSITPDASISEYLDYLTISRTYPVSYEVRFVSGPGFGRSTITQKQYLALTDVSSDYFSQIGFESGWNEDWNTFTEIESIQLSTSIVYSGAFSVKLDNTAGNGDFVLGNDLLPSSSMLYFSFTYYVENAPSDFKLNVEADATSIVLDVSVTNRWISGFYSAPLDTSVSSWNDIRFWITGVGKIYLDEFRVWEANPSAFTSDYGETTVKAKAISFDNRQNPPVPFTSVTLELRDRTADTLIDSYSANTDEYGEIEWVWKGRMPYKEIETRATIWESWWGLFSYDYFTENSLTWGGGSYMDIVTFVTDDVRTGTYSVKQEDDDTAGMWTATGSIDVSECDYIVLESRTNISSHWDNFLLLHSWNDYTKHYIYNFDDLTDTTGDLTTSWGNYFIDLSSAYSVVGTQDKTDITMILLDMPSATITNWLDSFRFIQSQKTYFTPSGTGNVDFALSELGNAWDFTEETLDGFLTTYSSDTKDGYYLSNVTQSYIYEVGFSAFDFTYYDTYSMRIKFDFVNPYSDMFFHLRDSSSNWRAWTVPIINTTDWQIVSVPLHSGFSEESGFDITSVIKVYSYDGTRWNATNPIYLDHLKITHEDSSLESPGFISEFNEPGYGDGWEGIDCSFTVDKGEISVSAPTDYDGIEFDLEEYYAFPSTYFVKAQIKSPDITTLQVDYYGLDGWRGSEQFTIGSDYAIYILTASVTSVNNIRYWVGTIGDYGTFVIDWIRIYSNSLPSDVLKETSSSFFTKSENNTLASRVWQDNQFWGDYFDGEFIDANLTTGSHTFEWTHWLDLDALDRVYLPSAVYYHTYSVTENDLVTLTFRDQQGKYIDARTFNIFVDDERLIGDTFLLLVTSDTFNLTICDAWNFSLYSDASETWERFKDFTLTLHSLKVQNYQENPIWVSFRRVDSEAIFSEWAFPGEVIGYKVASATYNVTVYYSTVDSDFSVATNGTTVSYQYAVSSDTAIRVSGTSIQDVFDNVVSLSGNLDDVNASLSNQIIDVEITVNNVNTSIANQIVNVDILLTNTNSSLSSQLISLNSDLSNVNSSIFSQTVSILSEISNVNVSLTLQTVEILSRILNVNTTLYGQSLEILVDIMNSNSTIYNQTVAIQTAINQINSTLYNQTVLLHDVFFSFSDGIGLGLPFETFKLYVNDSRQFYQELRVLNGTVLSVMVLDYFNVELSSDIFEITGDLEIVLVVDVYLIAFRNNSTELASIVGITRGNQTLTLDIPPEATIFHRFASGDYEINVSYVVESDIRGVDDPNFDIGIHNRFVGTVSFGSTLEVLGESKKNNIVDVSAPGIPMTLERMLFSTIGLGLVAVIITATISTTLAYIIRTRLIQPIDEKADFPTLKEKVQDPLMGIVSSEERKRRNLTKQKNDRRR